MMNVWKTVYRELTFNTILCYLTEPTLSAKYIIKVIEDENNFL